MWRFHYHKFAYCFWLCSAGQQWLWGGEGLLFAPVESGHCQSAAESVWGLAQRCWYLICSAHSEILRNMVVQELTISWQANVLQGSSLVCFGPLKPPAHLEHWWPRWPKGAHPSLKMCLAFFYIHNLILLGDVSVCLSSFSCFSRASCLLRKCKHFRNRASGVFMLLFTKRYTLRFSSTFSKCIGNFSYEVEYAPWGVN